MIALISNPHCINATILATIFYLNSEYGPFNHTYEYLVYGRLVNDKVKQFRGTV